MRRGSMMGLAGTLWLATVMAQAPGQWPQPPRSGPYVQYGTPNPATVSEIAGGRYSHDTVRVRGTLALLDPPSPYFRLRDGIDEIVVITVDSLQGATRAFTGQRVEVVGLVRELKDSQDTCRSRGQTVPESQCLDPDLPPTPDLGPNRRYWPRMSVTIWSIADARPLDGGRRSEQPEDASGTLAALLGDEGTSAKVHIRGRFCGRNLCGGLSTSPPDADAWVLQEGESAIWVVGKRPKGSGWSLDPTYQGDTKRWLEVVGRLRPCGATRCLQADSVALVKTPDSEEP
jgi:hypothetical protein